MPYGPPVAIAKTPANQAAIASATYVCNGFGAAAVGCILTPSSTGRVLVAWSGDLVENATAQLATVQMIYGTGAEPAAGQAVTGTAVGGELAWTSLTGQLTIPFALTYLITGLTPGTAYYFDLAGKSSAGTLTLTNCNFFAVEL